MKHRQPLSILLNLSGRAAGILPVLVSGTALLWLGLLAARRLDFFPPPWVQGALEIILPLLALGCAAGRAWSAWRNRARPEPFVNLLLDHIHEGLIATDNSLRVIYWGKGAEQMYGYSAAEALGKRIDQLLRFTGGEEVQAEILKDLQKSGWSKTYATFRRDGTQFCVESHLTLARDALGQVVGSIGVHRDVTDRWQAEQALEESEKRLRLLMENIHLAAVIMDMEGRITFCNDFLSQLSGWSKEEILGGTWIDRFTPETERTKRLEQHTQWMAGQPIAGHQERPMLTKTGEQRIMAWNNIVLRNREGQPTGLAAIGEDITERRRIEQDEERRMTELDTLRHAGRFMTTSSGITGALSSIAAAARLLLGSEVAMILLHNPKDQDLEVAALDGDELLLRRLIGAADPPLLGQRIPDSFGVAGWVLHQQRPVLVANLREIPGRENIDTPPHSLISVPLIYQGRAIGVIEVDHATIGAFNEHHQTILSMMADFATITVIHDRLLEAERAQRRLADQTQAQLAQSEKLNAIGRLVAFLAHEINNPLQSLRSGLNLMREVTLSEAEQREYLAVACREVDRLSEIVERVLGFTRRSDDYPTPVDLHHLLDETLALVEKRLAQSGVRVERIFVEALPPVDGFGGQLQQVFLNLVLNALEAMPRGGTLCVATLFDSQNKQVRVRFDDSGAGIQPEVMAHIFEPFYTTRADGNGLGLSICYSIVEKHQGRIEVESQPSRGSCFTVVLPVNHLPVEPDVHRAGANSKYEGKSDGRFKGKHPGC